MPDVAARLSLLPVRHPQEHGELVAWICASSWPFHLQVVPRPEQVATRVERGDFHGEEDRSFWLMLDGERAGLVCLHELGDLTPIFDLRLATAFRGRGLGGQALDLLARQVFEVEGKTRLEGHTRVDNVPMRRTFRKRGWVKESHHRRAWPGAAGVLHDAVTYALLREDWVSGEQTPVPWEEEPASTR
jgi:RimJ/RimL family protein N-acetyltransferase